MTMTMTEILVAIAREALHMGYHHYDRWHGDVHMVGESPTTVQVDGAIVREIFASLGWSIPLDERAARDLSGMCLYCGNPYDEDPALPHFHQRCLAEMRANEEAEAPLRERAERARAMRPRDPRPYVMVPPEIVDQLDLSEAAEEDEADRHTNPQRMHYDGPERLPRPPIRRPLSRPPGVPPHAQNIGGNDWYWSGPESEIKHD